MDYRSRIIELRKAHGLSRQELAESTHLSKDGIASYELGRRKPAFDALVALANCFNVSIDYITCRTNNPNLAK